MNFIQANNPSALHSVRFMASSHRQVVFSEVSCSLTACLLLLCLLLQLTGMMTAAAASNPGRWVAAALTTQFMTISVLTCAQVARA
jgi:hypothetical protein